MEGAWARRVSGARLLRAARVAARAQESVALPRGRPGPGPGAFRAQRAARPGKSRPLPGAAALPGSVGEGIPGICPETALASLSRIGPNMGSASGASAGKAPARWAGRGCLRVPRSVRGGFFPAVTRLPGVGARDSR